MIKSLTRGVSGLNLKGKCLCGEVMVEAKIPKPEIHACHCTTCRRWSSSPVFAVMAEHVSFTGGEKVQAYNSSEWADRGFCSVCGTSLFYRLKEPNQYLLCTGLFDTAFELTGEIYVDENPGGYAFAGEHPRLTGDEFLASMGQAPE